MGSVGGMRGGFCWVFARWFWLFMHRERYIMVKGLEVCRVME